MIKKIGRMGFVRHIRTVFLVPFGLYVAIGLSLRGYTADWPMWRCTPYRGGATKQELARELHLNWVRMYPALKPSSPHWRNVQFDAVYRPIVANGKMFVGSPANDTLIALDTKTGEEKWRFYTDGPIRLAPAAWNGKVYFGSDDGYLYCVNSENGSLLWKFRGGPSDRRCIGNERLISAWPLRGGPVISDGIVYFAAGVWPIDGIFIHALDAKTGSVVWTNDSTGYHEAAPQGHLVITDKYLLAPNGRSLPVSLDRKTGEFIANPGGKHHHNRFGSAGWHVSGIGGYMAVPGGVRKIPRGERLGFASGYWVVDDRVLYRVDGRHARQIDVLNLKNATEDTVKTKDGKTFKKLVPSDVASIPRSRSVGFVIRVKAGPRMYIIQESKVQAMDLEPEDARGKVSWQTPVDGTVIDLLAADDRLFAVTIEGGIYCFGPEKTETRTYPAPETAEPPAADEWTEKATRILEAVKPATGFCVVLGPTEPRLIGALARQSRLPVVALASDKEKVVAVRRALDAAGIYGNRCAAHVGDVRSFRFSPLMAGLVLLEDPAGVESVAKEPEALSRLFGILRPYGGTACLRIESSQHETLKKRVEEAALPQAEVKRVGEYSLLVRSGALLGSAEWTHENADAGKTRISRDTLVKAPLGTLWFGGHTDTRNYFDRHGRPPRPQVAGGRLITAEPNKIHATDAYTGLLMWESDVPGLGATYVHHRSVNGGAQAIGAWDCSGLFVSLADSIYVPYIRSCLRIDATTGKQIGEFTLPDVPGLSQPLVTSYAAVWKDILVLGAYPAIFPENGELFTRNQISERQATAVIKRLLRSPDAPYAVPRKEGESDIDYVVRNLNHFLNAKNVAKEILRTRLATRKSREGSIDRIVRRLTELESGKDEMDEKQRAEHRALNRKLLEIDLRMPGKWVGLDTRPAWSGTYSAYLVGMNRITGDVLWTHAAKFSFPHKGIVLGGGKVFFIDMPHARQAKKIREKGEKPGESATLGALDIHTGAPIWNAKKSFSGYLAYSEPNDILAAPHGVPDGPVKGLRSAWVACFRGSDGSELWSKQVKGMGGAPMLRGDTWLNKSGTVRLATAEPCTYRNPITQAEKAWTLGGFDTRCSRIIGSEHLLLFRSGAAAFYDMEKHTGLGHISGIRASCSAHLIVADGVLSAPTYAIGCSCPYPVHGSVTLHHVPENEQWTHYLGKFRPTNRIGINFGAPASFLAENGTLWIHYPTRGRAYLSRRTYNEVVTLTPKDPRRFCRYSSCMKGDAPGQVGASGIIGPESIEIHLTDKPRPDAKPAPYTVRLYFSEHKRAEPGRRVFGVSIQGKTLLDGFDIVKEAGGTYTAVVKKFKGVMVGDVLKIEFARPEDSSRYPPTICGIEIEKEM